MFYGCEMMCWHVHVFWTHFRSPGYPRALRTSRGQGNSRRAGTTLQPSLCPFIYFSPIPSSSLHLYASPHISWCLHVSLPLSLLLFSFYLLQYSFFSSSNFSSPFFITILAILLLVSLWQQTAHWCSLPSPVSSKISQPGESLRDIF